MVTILLQTIIDMLENFFNGFIEWANDTGDKIAAIKTNTDSLPGIKADTADIKSNTAAVITPISNINTNVTAIAPDVASIKADTAVIKNNANAIMTSSGQTAAYTKDIADNTLDCSNRLVTIGSDTTQIRADSGSMAADVAEIKNTLGLYLYNTFVTEDAAGAIVNFDTDLKDYLQNAVVTVPADAGGVSGISVKKYNKNLLVVDNVSQIDTTGNSDLRYGYSFDKPGTYRLSSFNTLNAYLGVKKVTNGVYGALQYFQSGLPSSISNKTITLSAGEILLVYNVGNDSESASKSRLVKCQMEMGSATTDFIQGTEETYTVTFSSPITDGAEVDLLTGLVKINTSPVTYDSFTPFNIRTVKGVNNIYSDIGDMSVTYRETLKHYLEKQEGN